MHSLISFATQWGSKLGGINSFNTDFLEAFGVAYYDSVQVICVVASATEDEIESAANSHVTLLRMPYVPSDKIFSTEHAHIGMDILKRNGINIEAEHTICLGHDRITGAAAIEAANVVGGISVIVHHMDYDHYESFAEDSQAAYEKNQEQKKLFKKADVILAVGPLLYETAHDLAGDGRPIHMLIPGLAEIEVSAAPKTFTAFMSGRLSSDAARIKQGHLGLAAFSYAHKKACEENMPDGLFRQPKIMLRGVDYTGEVNESSAKTSPEAELKAFAEEYAGRAVNLQALPYTHDRDELYENISKSSVALMPSWHEGFGLVAWEAIAAGVPLIISRHSGVYKLLEDLFPGNGTGCVYSIDVHGSNTAPFFRTEDLRLIADALKKIAHNPTKARQQAGALRGLLINEYTWSNCVVNAAKAFGWDIQKGSLSTVEPKSANPCAVLVNPQPYPNQSLIQMPPKYWKIGASAAESQLLRAEEALVPFEAARQPEVDALNTWLDDSNYPCAVRLLTGAGGLGKTRLALHLCEKRLSIGWHAGFLVSEFDSNALADSWKVLRDRGLPILIVVDYAETRQDDLLLLISSILASPTNSPIRILLLARDGGEWWENLPAQNKFCESLLSGYATSGPYALPPMHVGIQARQEAYRQALHAFAKALEVPYPDIIPELAGEHFGRPLYLQMAALLALRGDRAVSAQGLIRALLNHERRYWRGLFSGRLVAESERHAENLLALVTLTGGFVTPKALLPFWKKISGSVLSPAQVSDLFYTLVPLYPGKQGLQAVRPDLLGEALVAQALLRPSAADILDAVLGKNIEKSVRSNALTVLARLSQNYLELHETLTEALVRNFTYCLHELIVVAVETPSNLPILAEAAFAHLSNNVKNQVLGLLKAKINNDSVQLSHFYCVVSKYNVDKCGQQFEKRNNDVEAKRTYAEALHNFSNHLNNAGRNSEVLEPAQRALTIIEQLAQKEPDRFDPFYARSLSNYANHLGSSGRLEEALGYAQKALDIRERLVQKDAERYAYDHAKSLSNYAMNLGDAGRTEEALHYAGLALTIDERLAREDPGRFQANYARSLSNYSSHLSDVGSYDASLEPARQAMELHRSLALTNRDRFEPSYATSLGNYANRLGDVGRFEDALDYARQATNIHELLALKNPDRFGSDYAKSLGNYGSHLSDVNRNEEALEPARKALEINNRLMLKNQDRYEPDYAASLSNYARGLSDLGDVEQALEYARQALNIRERIDQKGVDRFAPEYALTLANYASHLCDVGCTLEALVFFQKALEMHKELAKKNPERFDADYARSLKSYARALSDLGRDDDSSEYIERALEIYQRLRLKSPAVFQADWFEGVCDRYLMTWVGDASWRGEELVDIQSIPAEIATHRHAALCLYSNFVHACYAKDEAHRSEFFKLVTSAWSGMSKSNRIMTENYWMCAVAWQDANRLTSQDKKYWQTEWYRFRTQRRGKVPRWMLEMASRLKFEWPI